MTTEIAVALCFILDVLRHNPKIVYGITVIPFCLMFIIGSLEGVWGILFGQPHRLGHFIRLQV